MTESVDFTTLGIYVGAAVTLGMGLLKGAERIIMAIVKKAGGGKEPKNGANAALTEAITELARQEAAQSEIQRQQLVVLQSVEKGVAQGTSSSESNFRLQAKDLALIEKAVDKLHKRIDRALTDHH